MGFAGFSVWVGEVSYTPEESALSTLDGNVLGQGVQRRCSGCHR